MVTQFNKTDLIQFAKFVLDANAKRNEADGFKNEVSHANFENWLEAKIHKGKIPVVSKFKVDGLIDDNDTTRVTLSVVIDGSEENKNFSKYTPSGHIAISIDNDADALSYFELEQEYLVKFTKSNK